MENLLKWVFLDTAPPEGREMEEVNKKLHTKQDYRWAPEVNILEAET